MKKKITTLILYVLNLTLFFLPWISIGEEYYNVFQFAYLKSMKGIPYFAEKVQIAVANVNNLEASISIEIMLFMAFFVLSIVHMYLVLINKKKPFNLAVLSVGVLIFYYHHSFAGSMKELCGDSLLVTGCMALFILIPTIEFFTIMVMERWTETVEESRAYQEEEKAFKKEKKERLAFAGKYDTPFYRIVWKNFKSNWKDYILLLFCGILIFTFVVIGYGVQHIMSQEHNFDGIQMLNGLNAILMNAIVPLAIVSVFIIIMLLFYYLKCRAKNYGVFLTLGMRRKALYYFAGLEFVSVFILSIVIGGVIGTGALALFVHYSEVLIGWSVEFSVINIKVYLKSILTVLFVFGASAMAARDIFVDFNVGKSTDLRAIGEKVPVKHRKKVLAAGFILCAICIYAYGILHNYEKIYYILGFFLGLFVVIRFGLADYLLRVRKSKKRLQKVIPHSQLFHKSKTSAGYISALAIMQFCVLFYFSFQLISSAIVEDNDVLFPYDIMCIAHDEDEEFFADLEEKYALEMYTYPMVRVSNYDSTEKWEGREDGDPPQGQHIGISESTFHELKKQLNPEYEKTDLGLDEEGSSVYIVHQQDKSVKAQPIDFYGSASRPILIVGQPITGHTDIARASRRRVDLAYKYRDVKGEEIGSLTGTFRQGLRENIVVFSDEFFEEAQSLWEVTDTVSGNFTFGEYYQMFFQDSAVIKQGPTKLVLINTNGQNLDAIEKELQEFKARNEYDEHFDASVSCYYMKEDAEMDLKTERYMKMVMNVLVMVIFFVMNIVLVSIKMLSELDANRRRADFLTCMGMRKKQRNALVKKEILIHHHVLPLCIAMISAIIFTITIWNARMYTTVDIQNYLNYMIPLWLIYIIGSTVVLWVLSVIYANTVEGKKYARRS